MNHSISVFPLSLKQIITTQYRNTLVKAQNKKPDCSDTMSEAIRESIITSEGHKYRGELRTFVGVAGLVCDGTGVMQYTNGDVYTGLWSMNKRQGNGTMQYADGSAYEGEWQADKRHGCGQIQFPSGETYEGSFVADVRQGMGTQVLPNGEKYTGAFFNNQRNGRGILDLVDGSSFEGMFKDGFMHGHGTLKLANGDEFVGNFAKSAMHGKGIYTFLSGDRFEGEYENGTRVSGVMTRRGGSEFVAAFSADGELSQLREQATGAAITFDPQSGGVVSSGAPPPSNWNDGEGRIALPSGEVYTGTIRDGARNGAGVLELANGDKYEGTWVDNQLQGEGKMVLDKPRKLGPHHYGWRYIGGFDQGRFHGFGVLNYDVEGGKYAGHWVEGLRDGLGKEECGEETYEGDFSADLRHGNGTLTNKTGTFRGMFVDGEMLDDEAAVSYADGTTYHGCIKQLLKDGVGRERTPNKDVYDGEFRNDLRHGVGVLTQANGDVYQGQWHEGHPHGSGCMTYADGMVYEGRFSKGMKHGNGVLLDTKSQQSFNVTYRNNNLIDKQQI